MNKIKICKKCIIPKNEKDFYAQSSTNNKRRAVEDENLKKCWDLNNLRPLNSKQNLIDGVRKTRHKL